MTKLDETTLKNVRDTSQKLKEVRVHRASDFLTKEEQDELRAVNARGKKSKRKFDDVDAFVAEIIARFGYEAYKAWGRGEITTTKMMRLVSAERARERQNMIPLYNIILATVTSCIRVGKGEKKPKGPKQAVNIIKREIKIAKGEI